MDNANVESKCRRPPRFFRVASIHQMYIVRLI